MMTDSMPGPAGDRQVPGAFWLGPGQVAVVVISCALAGSALAACSAATSATTSPAAWPPDTPAGAQAYWLVTAAAHPPISAAELRAHFDASFLARFSPDQINQALRELGGVAAVSVRVAGAAGSSPPWWPRAPGRTC